MDDEMGEQSPYIRSYKPPNTQIKVYKTLIQACKEYMVLEERKASVDIEKITYKDLEKEYRKFSLKFHPDKGGDEEKCKLGNKAWLDLQEKLKEDRFIPQDLKGVGEALLRHL